MLVVLLNTELILVWIPVGDEEWFISGGNCSRHPDGQTVMFRLTGNANHWGKLGFTVGTASGNNPEDGGFNVISIRFKCICLQ